MKPSLAVATGLALLLCGCEPQKRDMRESVVSEFLCYRAALGNEDEAKVLNHFSRLYLSEWLGSVLFVDEFAVDHNLTAVRGSVSVGDGINYVHDYRVSRMEDQRYSLTIIYSPVLGDSVRRLSLFYIADDDRYLIDGMEVHFYEIPKTSDEIVFDFTGNDLPEC